MGWAVGGPCRSASLFLLFLNLCWGSVFVGGFFFLFLFFLGFGLVWFFTAMQSAKAKNPQLISWKLARSLCTSAISKLITDLEKNLTRKHKSGDCYILFSILGAIYFSTTHLSDRNSSTQTLRFIEGKKKTHLFSSLLLSLPTSQYLNLKPRRKLKLFLK